MNSKQKHEVVTGRMLNGRIENPFWAGDAYYHVDGGFFELSISLFNEPWFVSRNQNGETYTIFKEKVGEGSEVKFRRPIGKAYCADKLKTYLAISVPLWNPRYQPFLSLFPAP